MKKRKWILISGLLWLMLLMAGITVQAAGYTEITYKGHTYRRYDVGMTWTQAKKYCKSLGGHLATITSSGEQKALKNLIKDGEKNQYWLGGTVENGIAGWITGEKFKYKNWSTGQPDNYGTGENYIQMYRIPNPRYYEKNALGKWNDITVDNHISGEEDFFTTDQVGFICEIDSLSINRAVVTLTKKTYTYDGKKKQPKVTVELDGKVLKKGRDYTVSYTNSDGIGEARVSVKGIGAYRNHTSVGYTIKPPKVKKLSLKTDSSGQVTASWKKVSGPVDGYKIVWSLTKDFGNVKARKVGNKLSKTYKKLDAGMTYYFRVCAYKKLADGSYLYGAWSPVKSVKLSAKKK